MSVVKPDVTVFGVVNVAPLPGGLPTRLHAKVNGLPSTSVDALPLRPTTVPIGTLQSVFGVAAELAFGLATGAVLPVVITTVLAALLTKPSLTMSCAV